jgi:hypothetical protein
MAMMTWHSYPSLWGERFQIESHDRAILRELAARYRDAATNPARNSLKALWKAHNTLKPGPVPVLTYAENWHEVPDVSTLFCHAEEARALEFHFRQLLWQHENILDDKPLDAVVHVHKHITSSGWGLPVVHKPGHSDLDAWGFVPVLLSPDDVRKIKLPQVQYDEVSSLIKFAAVQDALGDILEVRLSGIKEINFHLAMMYSDWRGLETLYTDFYDEPELLSDVLDIITQGYLGLIDQYEQYGLLELNNDGTYQGTGGFGYSDEFPAAGFAGRVRAKDMWSSAEAQELASVSPRMHREFFLKREAKLLERFGLNEYGCCEPLHDKLDDVLKMPGIRRISASPWADVHKFAEKVGRSTIISWKPNPSWLSGGYNPDWILEQLETSVKALKGCAFEIILEDLRTCAGHPERIAEWVALARRAIESNG